MCMGVATANSVLVISFARERLEQGRQAIDAALEAGFVVATEHMKSYSPIECSTYGL